MKGPPIYREKNAKILDGTTHFFHAFKLRLEYTYSIQYGEMKTACNKK